MRHNPLCAALLHGPEGLLQHVVLCCNVLQRHPQRGISPLSALRTTHHCVCRLRAAPQRVEEMQQQKAYMVQWEREGLLEHAKNLTKRRSQVKGCYPLL